MNPVWRIELLGSLRACRRGRVVGRFRSRKIGMLLAHLALHLDRAHPREQLIELLWPESEPNAGRQNLSQALSSLRHQLEPPGIPGGAVIQATRSDVRLNPETVSCDAGEFEIALRAGRAAASEALRDAALEQAVAIYKGELLPGFFEDWVLRARARLADAYVHATEKLADRAERSGDFTRALDLARRALDADPLSEESHRRMIHLLAVSGQPAAALRHYQEMAQMLADELDLRPEPETEQLVHGIRSRSRSHDSGPIPSPKAERTRANPPRKRPLVGPGEIRPLPGGTVTFLVGGVDAPAEGTAGSKGPGTRHACLPPRFRERFPAHSGCEVRWTREDFILAFPKSGDALGTAIACARAFFPGPHAGSPASESRTRPPIRMAIHSGDIAGDGVTAIEEDPALRHSIALLLAARAGQILCSETTAALLRRHLEHDLTIEDLGTYRLPGEDEPERVFMARIPEMEKTSFPPLRAERPYKGDLPLRLTRFFGRGEELRRLKQWIRDPEARVITLTGPGGTGKTRLAVELAYEILDEFPGGVWFVSLAELTEARRIPEAILEALHVRYEPGRDLSEQAGAAISATRAVIILDNFEHLIPHGAPVVHSLIEMAPEAKCVVTSRHRLGIPGEREYVLAPLLTPMAPDTPEKLLMLPSVQLFVDRAQVVVPDFQVTRGNASAIARLCARLEGIPLALELAAARSQVLTPSQMLKRLSKRLDFLVSRRTDLALRHRTVRAAIDWSHRLLTRDLQDFFARLAVFQGSWNAEAAESVCGEPLALDFLAQLRESSLVQAFEGADEMRFRMLDTIREYASERLPAELKPELTLRHATHFLQFAEEAESHLRSRERIPWLNRMAMDQENFAAALNALAGGAGGAEIEMGLRLASALSTFWQLRGNARMGRGPLEQFLALSPVQQTGVYTKALNETGFLAFLQGDYPAALRHLETCLTLCGSMEDRTGIALALSNLGNVALFRGEFARAGECYRNCLDIRRELGDRHNVARALHNLGNLANAEGDYPTARELLMESLAIKQEFGDPWDIAGTLQSIGNVAANQGDGPAARAYYESCLALRREVGDRQGIAHVLNNLALAVGAEGDLVGARSLHEESLAIKRELGDRRGVAGSLLNLGGIAYRMEDFERAARLFSAAAAMGEALGFRLPPKEQKIHDDRLDGIRTALGPASFARAWERGRLMQEAEVVGYALRALAETR